MDTGKGGARGCGHDAGVRRAAVPSHGVPEGEFDDDGRVVPDAQLQVQDAVAGVRLAERAVVGGRCPRPRRRLRREGRPAVGSSFYGFRGSSGCEAKRKGSSFSDYRSC